MNIEEQIVPIRSPRLYAEFVPEFDVVVVDPTD